MHQNIIIYEDLNEPFFNPLTYMRSVFELKCGMLSFLERIYTYYPEASYHLFTRDFLKPALQQRYPSFQINTSNIGLKSLVINGRLILNEEVKTLLDKNINTNFIIIHNDEIVALGLEQNLLKTFITTSLATKFDANNILSRLRKNNKIKIIYCKECLVIKNIWDLITVNGKVLRNDFNLINRKGLILTNLNTQVCVTDEDNIFIGKKTKVNPFVHLDASNGPIYIGEHVEIKAHVIIDGPTFIDDHTIIYPGYIRGNTTIGSHCRIGGEVINSIFQGYSNKAHTGFLGHSYIGEWVNLGAATTTSNLKNTYSKIVIPTANETLTKTNLQFLGSLIGDYVKCGIGTMLNTGSSIGLGANIFGADGIMPKYIPNFSWGTSQKLIQYKLSNFLKTSRIVMKRRKKDLLKPEEELLKYLYQSFNK